MKAVSTFLAFGLVVAGWFVGMADRAVASPAFGGDCVGCHVKADAMPGTHIPIKNMTPDDCAACHPAKSSALPPDTARPALLGCADGACLVQVTGKEQKRLRKQSQATRHSGGSGASDDGGQTSSKASGDAAVPDSAAKAATAVAAHASEAPCVTCHSDMAILPDGHMPTAGMSLEKCEACHAPDGPMSIAAALNLDHGHYMAGVECAACHGDADPKAEPDMDVCTDCHGDLAALAEATAGLPDANPHDSPHGAPYAECSLCHMQHEPSDNFCATCHDFDFTVP